MPSEPNATCPICGARVYFWKSQAGSKVWFDALGKPWPKHPCLDIPTFAWGSRRKEVASARVNAEGPVSAARKVEIAGSDGAGCGCLLLVVGIFLIACVINWWRLLLVGDPGNGGAVGTTAATAVVVALLIAAERLLTAASRRRALERALDIAVPSSNSVGDPPSD